MDSSGTFKSPKPIAPLPCVGLFGGSLGLSYSPFRTPQGAIRHQVGSHPYSLNRADLFHTLPSTKDAMKATTTTNPTK